MQEPEQSIPGGPSARVRVARLARDTALTTPGVAALDDGPTGNFVTVGGGERIAGVRCAVAPGGGFDVSVRLVCELVPLRPVGDWVRKEIAQAALRDGLEVETVSIEITNVLDEAHV